MADACNHHDHHVHQGLGSGPLLEALAEAELRCAASQERLTPPRRRVLELLLAADAPLKAYDLIAAYGPAGEPAKPPTVYRALEFLARHGFAHRIESLNAYIACGGGSEGHAAAFLICDCCGRTREIAPAGASEIERLAAERGFTLTGLTVEAHGRCQDCAA